MRKFVADDHNNFISFTHSCTSPDGYIDTLTFGSHIPIMMAVSEVSTVCTAARSADDENVVILII